MRSQYFGFMHCGYCEYRFCTAGNSGLAGFRGSLLWIHPVLFLSIWGFCAAGTASTGSILSVGLARAASEYSQYHMYHILSICSAYSGVRRILGPSVHRDDKFKPIVLQKTFTDGATSESWRKLRSVGETGVPTVPVVFRESILRVLAVFWLCTADTACTPTYFGVRYCGYCLYSDFCTAHTPKYSQYLGLQYCSYSQYCSI